MKIKDTIYLKNGCLKHYLEVKIIFQHNLKERPVWSNEKGDTELKKEDFIIEANDLW